jgi:hypothetical protein
MPGVGTTRFTAMSGVITDEVRGGIFDATAFPYVTAYVSGTGTINAGKISFEEADYAEKEMPYTGTWSNLGATYDVTASGLSGGKQQAIHFPVAKYRFVRPFIETAIGGGGSVSVVFVGTGAS